MGKTGSQNRVTKRGNKGGLQFRTGFRDCKSGQEGLQIGLALGISNWGKKIQGLFQIGAKGFQIGAGITNRCKTLKHKKLT